MDRLDLLDQALIAEMEGLAAKGPARPSCAWADLTDASGGLALFEAQLRSRALDRAARRLRASGDGYYTIASAGHERNALLGQLLAPDDPCLLHYRSGALVLARAARCGYARIARDVLLSLCAAREDPIAEGRHKVWGSAPLWIVPQTSTIASHLPKAVGLALGLSRAHRLGISSPVSRDAIVVCSFGDASANHASALTAINAARYAHRRGHGMPILFVCEDNGLGISERQPSGWLESLWGAMPGLDYVPAKGSLVDAHRAVADAIARCRRSRAPVLLHMETVRLGGHAGSDAESAYLLASEIADLEARDPLRETARALVEAGWASAADLLDLRTRIEDEIDGLVDAAARAPHLDGATQVMAPLPPLDGALEEPVDRESPVTIEDETTRPLAEHLNGALSKLLESEPSTVLFGEDVGRKGGVYGITAGLQRRFGSGRVFDTQLDETSILGAAQGVAMAGLLPIAEIQYLAYLHNAIDQLRGEACSLSFFSSGAFRNPLVVRIASFAYQKGFGGHFHNDNAVASLREIPGLVIAAPCFGDDAARMLHAAARLAQRDGRVVAFLEPIALYFERDLYTAGDGLFARPATEARPLMPGRCGVYGGAQPDLVLVSYANGLRFALRVARRLEEELGRTVRCVDLRWLAPLPLPDLLRHVPREAACLVVDECRRSGGVADTLVAALVRAGHRGPLASVSSEDCYVPLGPAAGSVLLDEARIDEAARALLSP